jgi:hypothetical protein
MTSIPPLLVLVLAFAAAAPSLLESEPRGWVDITPGPRLEGWTRAPIKSELKEGVVVWKVDPKTKVLSCFGHLPPVGPPGKEGSHEVLRHGKELGDFVFHVEWRFVDPARKGWNSGIFARASADHTVWYQAQAGNAAGGFWFGDVPDETGKGKVTRQKLAPLEQRVKPAGEWNVYELIARGDRLTLWANGAVTCEWSGVTVRRGHVGLEAEFHHVEFRNLKLKELPAPRPPRRR